MNVKLNNGEAGNSATRGWLAGLLLRHGGDWLPRAAFYYQALARRPRRWRRQLQRRLAVTISGAALLLALAGPIAPVTAGPDAPGAVIQVVNGEVADVTNGKCSLIEAIINARTTNANQLRPDCAAGNLSGQDTVSLPANGVFVLTAAHNQQFGPTGLPVITSRVIIAGNGARIQRSAVSGTPDFRILAVDDAGNLTIRNTVILNGQSPGYSGGGILNKNVLTVESSQLLNNIADYHGGGIYAEPGSTTTISDSLIAYNRVWADYNSGGGVASAGSLTITNSTVEHNRAPGGGGIGIAAGGTATVTGSRVINNAAVAEYGGAGGGIAIAGSAVIRDSTIAGNLAAGGMDYGGYGGGIIVGSPGVTTITGSTISGNSATSGGEYGCCSAPFDGPGMGGGIAVFGTAAVSNTTISGNDANRGGGVMNDGQLTLVHSTVTGNLGRRDTDEYEGFLDTQPGRGGGLYSGYFSDGCEVTTLKGTIISGNTAADGGPEAMIVADDECSPVVNRDSFNLFGHSGNAGLVGFTKGATDIVPAADLGAILGPLADNGGPTQTHALLPGSPALDVAPNAQCAAAPVNGVDQRGRPRNLNGTGAVTANECDAGSFELAPPPTFLPFLISAIGSGRIGGVAFVPGDILKFDPATGWSMFFDGSDVGVTKNLAAFEVLDNGDILMSFAAGQPIAGVGTFRPQDVARFHPTATGPNTAGTFRMEVDGSDHFLTTVGEKIDALGLVGDGRLAISTAGLAAVNRPDGTTLRAQDEDALGYRLDSGAWSAFFDGTAIPGLSVEDVNALWVDPPTGEIYISIAGAFNIAGVRGNGKDIVKLTPSGAKGGYTPSLWWDGSAAGFPTAIDGLEILP